MLVAFSVAPSGAAPSAPGPSSPAGADGGVADAVADAVRVVRASGLPHRTDSMFTTIEGEWDECMDVVKRCVEAVARHGSRVSLVLKADVRTTEEHRTGQLQGKLDRLEAAVERTAGEPGRGQ